MMHQPKGEKSMDLIHEGKAKRVLQDPDSPERVIIEFTDTVTAGDGDKKEDFTGKGTIACEISKYLFKYLMLSVPKKIIEQASKYQCGNDRTKSVP